MKIFLIALSLHLSSLASAQELNTKVICNSYFSILDSATDSQDEKLLTEYFAKKKIYDFEQKYYYVKINTNGVKSIEPDFEKIRQIVTVNAPDSQEFIDAKQFLESYSKDKAYRIFSLRISHEISLKLHNSHTAQIEKEIDLLVAEEVQTRKLLSIVYLKSVLHTHLSKGEIEIVEVYSDGLQVNKKFFNDPGSVAAFTEGVPSYRIRVEKNMKLVRIHNADAKGYAGSWFLPYEEESIWLQTKRDVEDFTALPLTSKSEKLTVVEFEVGDEFILGGVGSQVNAPGTTGYEVFGDSRLGGNIQYWRTPEKMLVAGVQKQPYIESGQAKETFEVFRDVKLSEIQLALKNAKIKSDMILINKMYDKYRSNQVELIFKHVNDPNIEERAFKDLDEKMKPLSEGIIKKWKEIDPSFLNK